ncbi:hypothetical protein [Absidia glauca]|uniref:Uncharacterized protein n=1 Tax=Absidia glauca TaxID=4829 RepID=A0A163MEF8_ABSGL|nr:hypothetical protein [Absidia glauca]
MQLNRLQDSTVKAPSPLGRRQSTTFTQSTDHLDHILHSVRQQIERWGSNAKWKIDLVLTEPSAETTTTDHTSSTNPPPPPPPQAMPTTTTTTKQPSSTLHALSVSASTQFPWDYVAPYHDSWNRDYNEDQEQQLREALERNQYLESIVRSQADQLGQSPALPPDVNNVVETMKQIYLMSENEQRLRYVTETRMLHKDIQTLTKRLQRMAHLLHTVENMELTDKEADLDKEQLLEDRKRLQKKLHLNQVRLQTRDLELEFLNMKRQKQQQQDEPSQPPSSPSTTASAQMNVSPRIQDRTLKNRPYLFQQQYSPKLRSDIRPNTISGLDSLGILADQMLSDPDFETQHVSDTERSRYATTTPPPPSSSSTRRSKLRKRPLNHFKEEEPDPTIYYYNRPAYSSSHAPTYYNEKRSKRSIDSANTLLSMFPSRSPPAVHHHHQHLSDQGNRSNRSVLTNHLLSNSTDMPRPPAGRPPQMKPKSKLAYVRWNPDEDQLLRNSVERNGTSNWDKVAQMVPDRSSQQCRQRWSKYLDQKHGNDKKPTLNKTASEPTASSSTSSNDARHSPSIASLLNSDGDSHKRPLTSSTSPPPPQPVPNTSTNAASSPPSTHPYTYHPPSPVSTPKNTSRFVDGFNRS